MLVDVPGSAPRICARCTSRLPAVLPIPETTAETIANMGAVPQFARCRNEPIDRTPLVATMNTIAPQRSPTLRTNVNCRWRFRSDVSISTRQKTRRELYLELSCTSRSEQVGLLQRPTHRCAVSATAQGCRHEYQPCCIDYKRSCSVKQWGVRPH